MSDNIEYPIELKEDQHEYLREMAEKYALQDLSKAVRCLINYARENSDLEGSIYEEIRCLYC